MAAVIRPLRNIGAEVLNIDPEQPVSTEDRDVMYRAWLEHGVLLFRGMGTSAHAHIQLSRCFGELEEHVLKALLVDDHKELIAVERGGKPMAPSYYIRGTLTTGYLFWHQDLCYTPTISKGGMLRMIEMPESGGETGWIDTIKSYDALPEATKQKIDGLEVRMRLRTDLTGVPFGLDPSIREASQEEVPWELAGFPKFPDVIHPLVSIHPETGRKSLAISPLTLVEIVGMDSKESDDLLRSLVEHSLREEFMLVHRWAINDMVLWDNRRTIHSAFGHPPGQTRVAYRTTLAGGMTSGKVVQ